MSVKVFFGKIPNMIDIDKQISYWRNSAIEDWEVAESLIKQNKIRHGLFFAHLSLEKVLKAHVCHHTRDLAPRIHNTVQLAQIAGLKLNDEQINILADTNEFNIEGRYPSMLLPLPSNVEVKDYMKRIKGVLECLNSLF